MASTTPRISKGMIGWVIVALLTISIGISWYLSNLSPIVVIPPLAKLPSPNARDFYQQAYQKLTKAISSTIYHGKPLGPVWLVYKPSEEPTAKKELAIAVTGDAMLLLHEGFKYPYQVSQMRYSNSDPLNNSYHEIARYLQFRGTVQSSHGDWNGAVMSDLDAIRLGNDPPKEYVLAGVASSYYLQNIGRNEIWPLIDLLDSREAHAATVRLQQIVDGQTSLAQCLEGEKYTMQALLMDIFKRRAWRNDLLSLLQPNYLTGEPTIIKIISRSLTSLSLSKRRIMDEYTRYMDQLIAEARKPYPLRKVVIPNSEIVPLLTHGEKNIREAAAVNEVENALLLTSLTLRAYNTEHGKYPVSLHDLTPKYLKVLPNDTFAKTGPLCYQRTSSKYVLYSIGPDGKDDTGKPINFPHAPIKHRYDVFHYSNPGNGDIVAGVNLSGQEIAIGPDIEF